MMTLLLCITLVSAVALFWSLADGPQIDHLQLVQPHHGYVGLVVVIYAIAHLEAWPAGFLLWRAALWALAAFGAWLLADDAYQHARQRWGEELAYRSPAHRMFVPFLLRIPIIREWL